MFEKKSVLATAIIAGLVSGIALADDTAAPAADAAPAKASKKKNSCGDKKKHAKKKGEKDGCSGPNGCGGHDDKKPAEAEKKAE